MAQEQRTCPIRTRLWATPDISTRPACSSGGERRAYTSHVAGANPAAPTSGADGPTIRRGANSSVFPSPAPDSEALAYLYDDTAPRIAKNLRPNPESVRSILDQIALDDPRAKQLSEKDHWNLTLLDERQQAGWPDKLYKR